MPVAPKPHFAPRGPRPNDFGRPIPLLKDCILPLQDLLHGQLVGILSAACDGAAEKATSAFFEVVAASSDDIEAAASAQRVLGGARDCLRQQLPLRSATIVNQIRRYLPSSGTILDYGCGDGRVGLSLSDTFSVSLCDVKDYRAAEVLQRGQALRWVKLPASTDRLSNTAPFDAVLLLTVLHHCEDPEYTLDQISQLAPKRIVSIESVYSVTPGDLSGNNVEAGCRTDEAERWLLLDHEDQFRYACFWDWFYNKVIHGGVIVPYNFSWPDSWVDRLDTIQYTESARVYLGIDQPLVPEFHVLQVFEPKG